MSGIEPEPVIMDASARARMAALTRYGILDTDRDAIFDGIAELASALLDAPIAVVNFIADDRQWFKAEIGIGQRELPLDVSICRIALPERGLFVVPDLTADDRFACNPLVTAVEGLRFYAGMVLESDGVPIGTVCVLDTKPRANGITAVQRRGLEALAVQAMAALERMAAARRDRYRLALTERLRDAGDAEAMMEAAIEALGRYLAIGQVGFAEVEDDQAHCQVHRHWTDGRVAPMVGRWRMDDFGPDFIRDLKAGQSTVIADVTLDTRTNSPAALERFEAIATRAMLNVGLFRDGLMRAVLFLQHHDPRPWSTDEVALVEETVERLWSSVERRRAEVSLLQSEATARAQAAQIEAIYNAAPVGLGMFDAQLRYVSVNDRLANMNGASAADHIGKTPLEVMRDLDAQPELAAQLMETFNRALAGEAMHGVQFSGTTVTQPGALCTWRANYLPMADGADAIVGVVLSVEEVTSERAAQDALTASEARLSQAQEFGDIGSWEWDHAASEGIVSASFRRLLGVTAGEPITGERLLKVIHPDDHAPFAEAVSSALAAGEQFSVEYRITLPSGEERYIRSTGKRISADAPARSAGVVRDVTEAKRQEEHVRLLMGEVNHRAKNMLTVVQAIAKRTMETQPENFIESFGQRIQALVANQDLLVRSEWAAVSLGELVRSQLAHFGDARDARVTLDGPPVDITASASQAIGMALHELATNAVKYGALSNEVGRVAICWDVRSDAAGKARLTMSWTESGGPPVAKPTRHGFGSTVLGRMTKMSLDCEADIDFAPSGLVWRIDCPAAGLIKGSAVSAPKPNGAALTAQPAPTSGRGRVLVVEDEPMIALDTAHALTEAGYDVIGPANSVASALALLAQSGCDAAVLDVNLGAYTAEPIAQELIRRGVPFIVTSGYTREQQPELMRTAPLLGKPVKPALLLAEIERCLGS